MFFKKKLTGLAVALLASSSIVFGQQNLEGNTLTINGDGTSSNNVIITQEFNPNIPANGDNIGDKFGIQFKYPSSVGLKGTGIYNVSESTWGNTNGLSFHTSDDLYKSSKERMRISSNGNVGIGINNPEGKLHVKGGDIVLEGKSELNQVSPTEYAAQNNFSLIIKSPTSAPDVSDFKIESIISENGRFNNHRPLSMGYVGGEKLYFSHDQIDITKLKVEKKLLANQVVIGTTLIPQGYKLAIDGKMICEGVRVEMSNEWPDYVFKSDYKLNSLEEVEQHITKNGHLPNIPSQEEVMDNGVDLGEMQKLQMEKIEELTLYLIEQNKKIKTLEKQLEVLNIN